MTGASLAELARRVRRLPAFGRLGPEAVAEERDEIASELLRLARAAPRPMAPIADAAAVTERAAALPDETPVEELPLRQHTINALRGGGVLTLGDLRLMRDADLLRLRQFGRLSLADVRALVPAPDGRPR